MTSKKDSNNPNPDASIIVCTYNRAVSLDATLKSLAKQKTPEHLKWEVIVVDNNSSDNTKSVVSEWQNTFPQLRYEHESAQGLSHARNRGISAASGEFLLFTDDDVRPEADWLETVVKNMKEYGCDACGGYIAPIWEKEPPKWLTEIFYGFLAIRTETDGPYQITSGHQTPFGANMAFRREVFDEVGIFDTTRGRKGSVLASGEDGELFERLIDGGYKVMYFPDTRVHHCVEAFRTEKKYFRRWRYQTSCNIAQSRGFPGTRRIFGVPLYLFPQSLRAIAVAVKGRLTLPPDEAFYKEMIVFHFLGVIRGLLKRHKMIQAS